MAPHAMFSDDESRDYTENYEATVDGFVRTPSDSSANSEAPQPVRNASGPVPMAICGMACRLPGGINSPQELWGFLLDKKDARGEIPMNRYNADGWYAGADNEKSGCVRSKNGYFIENDPATMDPTFFSMTSNELERTDPQQRQLLEVVREAIEDAGVTNYRGSKTGVWVGSMVDDWMEIMDKDSQQYGVHRVIGQGDFALPNRISYEMDLRGPSAIIRTACAASLMGLHDACVAIANGDCNAAVVSGVNMILTPTMTVKLFEQGAISPDASCKTFSADANGYARAEGANAVYIKPLADAIRDGNPIRAVIRASGVNHDGKTPGITSPGGETQEALIRHTYQRAGITDFSETGFAELHGTGTAAGDPIEAKAIGRVFGQHGIHIGSIKPNIGHGEGAAGLSSLIKCVMALENRTIPPNIKFNAPNPKIPFDEMKLTVPVVPIPWPTDRKERASINCFGIGGSNVHVILESAASHNVAQVLEEAGDAPQLLVYSANTADALTKTVNNYSAYLAKNPERIEDLAFTLANKREHLAHRAFVVADREKPGAISAPQKPIQAPNKVFVFTGQGAQWPQMGKELMKSNAEFKSRIKSLDATLKALSGGPDWTIESELRKPAKTSRLHLAEWSQPICTAVQVGLLDALAAVGVRPDAVVGHSSGEIAAAYAAGALTADQAIVAAYHRGQVSKRQQRKGGMAAIGMGWDDVKPFLIEKVGVACENSPKSVTLSGDLEKLEEVVAEISKANPSVLARMLKVEKAYHSYHMAEIGEDYYQMVGPKMFGQPPVIPFFSSVTGKLLPENTLLGARYWQSNLENPVLFRSAVLSIMDHPVSKNAIFLEVGPHGALAGPLRQILSERGSSVPYASVLSRGQSGSETYLAALGKLFTLNVPVDFSALYPIGTTLSDLPRYPWNHSTQYWHENRAVKEWRMRAHRHHDLLGVKTHESTDYEPVWRNLLHLGNAPWLRDHQIGDDIIFPFAGFVAMAGEAIRQVTGVQEGFKIRDAAATTALVTPEGAPVELITTLRRHRLTKSEESDWWEFTIGSHNGHVWNKHCNGQIKAMSEGLGPAPEEAELPRKVDTKKWFQTVRQGGNMYGPKFQCNENMRASTTLPGLATATVKNGVQGDEENYHIHPTLLDSQLQLLVTASSLGLGNNFKQNVASTVAELAITRCYDDMKASVSAAFFGSNGVLGNGIYTANRQVVMRMTDFTSTILDSLPSGDLHAAARHVWKSDIHFQNAEDLFDQTDDRSGDAAKLEKLVHISLAQAKQSVQGLEAAAPHLKKYLSFIQSSHVGEPTETAAASVKELVESLSETPAAGVAQAISQITDSLASIITGESQPMDVLDENDAYNDTQTYVKSLNSSQFITSLAHSRPNLRVLELGAGTGAATAEILSQLGSSFSKYLFTDFSSNQFNPVKEQFKNIRNIDYATLDISGNLEEQGVADREFDLIIANQVLHQTEDIASSLTNIRSLLHPQGRLLLQELTPTSKWANYVFGALPSFSRENKDGREGEPYIGAQAWEERLEAHQMTVDHKVPGAVSSIFVAKPNNPVDVTKNVTLLRSSATSDVSKIEQSLKKRGYEVTLSTLEDVPIEGQDVISVADLEGPFVDGVDATTYGKLQTYINNIKDAGIFWVTGMATMNIEDPRYGTLIGLSRTIRSETGLAFAVCQTDGDFADDKVLDVFEKYHARQDDDAVFDDEMEYAIVNGNVNIGRLYPHAVSEELMISHEDDKIVLAIERPGRLEGLHWVRQASPAIMCDEVEIEVYATGLNAQDIAIASGQESGEAVFGVEAAGIVRAVGPKTQKLRIGDRVMVFANNAFASEITTTENLAVKIPHELIFTEAATMPASYATALYSLVNVGGLEKGQSVLIHNATDGHGLAAVQVANFIGATVYATVSNDEKARYLTEQFCVSSDRIFDSKDVSFAQGIKTATKSNGVDLVLNSLSGELLHASWKCVAEFGKMVEIGKRDLSGAAKLDMEVFLRNRSYAAVDLDRIRVAKPQIIARLLESTIEYYKRGLIKPLNVAKTFNTTEIHEAFIQMQQAAPTGKFVVTADSSPDTPVADRKLIAKFDSAASYLLIGGLGGVGHSVSTWMVEHGARHLIYLSRSAGTKPEDQQLVRELESMGATASLIKGSVTSAADTEAAVAAAGSKPLKGVIQMSMVLRDQLFANMSFEDWEAASAPKIQGTWNLHNATLSQPLDFFVCFSSITGVIGNKGQANYGAANTFLDAFTQFRNNQGLPATSIDLGVVEDVGVVSTSQELLNTFRAQGFWTLKEQQVLDALVLATSAPSPKAAARFPDATFVHPSTFVLGLASTVPLSSDKNRAVWRRDPRMAVYHNSTSTENAGASSSSGIKAFLNSAKADASVLKTPEAEQILATEIGRKLLSLLMKDDEEVNISLGLSDLGMDSLIAIDMRQWWKQAFGFDISTLEMLGMGTLEVLGKHAAKGLAKAIHGE